MATITLVNRQKWALRSLFLDVLAIGVMLIANVFLLQDMYHMGQGFRSVMQGGSGLAPSILHRISLEAILLVVSYAWVAFRVISAGYRRATDFK